MSRTTDEVIDAMNKEKLEIEVDNLLSSMECYFKRFDTSIVTVNEEEVSLLRTFYQLMINESGNDE